jgi:hypothetical protein
VPKASAKRPRVPTKMIDGGKKIGRLSLQSPVPSFQVPVQKTSNGSHSPAATFPSPSRAAGSFMSTLNSEPP